MKSDKQIIAAHKKRFELAYQMADELFPPNIYQKNCIDQDGDVITVTQVWKPIRISEKVGCFKLPLFQ